MAWKQTNLTNCKRNRLASNVSLLFTSFVFLLLVTSCELNDNSRIDQLLEEVGDEMVLIPMVSDQTEIGVAKTTVNEKVSPYTCRISTKLNEEAEYNYWNKLL